MVGVSEPSPVVVEKTLPPAIPVVTPVVTPAVTSQPVRKNPIIKTKTIVLPEEAPKTLYELERVWRSVKVLTLTHSYSLLLTLTHSLTHSLTPTHSLPLTH